MACDRCGCDRIGDWHKTSCPVVQSVMAKASATLAHWTAERDMLVNVSKGCIVVTPEDGLPHALSPLPR